MRERLTIEYVKKSFEKEGYELLSKEYVNAQTKLDYICSKGHRHSIIWNSWQRKRRCPYCAKDAKLTIEFIIAEFSKRGCKLLTKKYIDNKQKLDYICPKGHKHSTTWRKWRLKKYVCDCENDHSRMPLDYIRKNFEKEGYNLLIRRYIDNKQKLEYICPNGHKHSITWNDWQQGHRCPECIITFSKGEIQVRNFVESLGITVLPNNRNQIFSPETKRGLELDIFMPGLGKAIEYNGEYWHEDKSRDLLKQRLCKDKNIDLLTILDKEWKIEKDVCKSKIKKFLSNV